MKIALVIDRMDVSRGGREASTAQTAAALAARGHDVTILCQRGTWSHADVAVKCLGVRGLWTHTVAKYLVADVQSEISRTHYDIVHTTLPVPGANVYQPRGGTLPGQAAAGVRRRGAVAGWFAGIGKALNLRHRLMARLEQEVMADEKVLCLPNSRMVAEEIADYYQRTEGVRVVYNAVEVPDVDDEQRADWRQRHRFRLEVGPDDPVFITVAKNFALKGVDRAISCFAKWYHAEAGRKARLVVVGRDVVEGYQRHASLRDVGRQVVFVPPTENVFEWLAAADACILLSWYDPCSRVVLEATRWGIPSMTTSYNGAAEVLVEAGAGIVVPSPRSTTDILGAMTALADADGRSRLSNACLAVADRLSTDRHVDELLEAYGAAAGG